ncbi:MAG TPA: transposase [Longimicrobiaceae bacterium]
MVPTLTTTLGVKGHRPVVGTRDCKDLLYAFAAVDCVTGKLHTRTLECPAAESRKAREHKPGRVGLSKTRRLQEAFAAHLRDVGKAYPPHSHPRVVLVIDNAPWHRGGPVAAALADNPHLQLYRLPSYSPRLAVIERFWKVLRRRATHNRLFDSLRDLKASLRNSLRYFQTVRSRIMSLIGGCYENETASAGT